MSQKNKESSEPSMADLSGRQLGDYRLLRRLGRGAMAEVYLAEQCSLHRQVALKVLKRELAADQTYIQRFQREAQAAASLVHANIVQIHEVGCIDGVYFIAQEYVQGLNLRQWIGRHGPADVKMALIVMRQVTAALARAAERGIVHRDIKPENIMITRSGEVKVADFGLARIPRKGDAVDLTQAGMTMGTPLYMSPEQVEGNTLDPRSDLYSLGVTCYHMLAGSPPFDGETALSVAVQHLKKQPTRLENQRPDLPPGLCRVVHKMLAKAPEHRYQSPHELLKDLRALHFEQAGVEWPEELPDWDTTEFEPVLSRQETTQRLQTLMAAATSKSAGRRWFWWVAGSLAAFVCGAVLALATVREPHLLGPPPVVKPREDIRSQFYFALLVGTEEAYQAVLDYFPDGDPNILNSARRQLVFKYLLGKNYDKALEILERFASADTQDPELRAFGLAGEYWVLTRREEYEKAADALSEFWPIRSELKDPWMAGLLWRTLRQRKPPGQITEEQFQEWLDSLELESTEDR
jgi:serine/threonine-protein kinase